MISFAWVRGFPRKGASPPHAPAQRRSRGQSSHSRPSLRIGVRGSRIEDRGSGIGDRGSGIGDRGSRIEDRGPGIAACVGLLLTLALSLALSLTLSLTLPLPLPLGPYAARELAQGHGMPQVKRP